MSITTTNYTDNFVRVETHRPVNARHDSTVLLRLRFYKNSSPEPLHFWEPGFELAAAFNISMESSAYGIAVVNAIEESVARINAEFEEPTCP